MSRKLSLVLCFVGFVALAVIVGSPFAEDIDDAFVIASLYVGIPLLLISSAVLLSPGGDRKSRASRRGLAPGGGRCLTR